jgi:hypothetical protein
MELNRVDAERRTKRPRIYGEIAQPRSHLLKEQLMSFALRVNQSCYERGEGPAQLRGWKYIDYKGQWGGPQEKWGSPQQSVGWPTIRKRQVGEPIGKWGSPQFKNL